MTVSAPFCRTGVTTWVGSPTAGGAGGGGGSLGIGTTACTVSTPCSTTGVTGLPAAGGTGGGSVAAWIGSGGDEGLLTGAGDGVLLTGSGAVTVGAGEETGSTGEDPPPEELLGLELPLESPEELL